jgi:hypothetical protein
MVARHLQRNLLYMKPNLWSICEHDIYIISIKEIVSQLFVLDSLMKQHQWHVENILANSTNFVFLLHIIRHHV